METGEAMRDDKEGRGRIFEDKRKGTQEPIQHHSPTKRKKRGKLTWEGKKKYTI